ncbi:hypothetical protein D3C73_1128040 [compost metagenome]
MRRIRVISGILHGCADCRVPAAALPSGQHKRMPEPGRQIDLYARRSFARDQQERSTFGGCGRTGARGVATAQRSSGTAVSWLAPSQLCRRLPLSLCCRNLATALLWHCSAPRLLQPSLAPLLL